jgi:hypothetical protein
MTSTAKELPHFVRKQVELATQRLHEHRSDSVFSIDIIGLRVLIKDVTPHPTKPTTIKLPLALLDYSGQGWTLLFRTGNGQWQHLPEWNQAQTLDIQIQRFIDDDYKVFWRQ